MTLITGFFRDGCPILMGDLLVSDNATADKEFLFPTVGRVSKKDISKGEYSPSHLCQKAIQLSPKLAICWANKKIYASSFIKEIIRSNAHIDPSYDLLMQIYSDLCGQNDLSIIGILRNGTEMQLFDFESWPVDFPDPGFQYFKAAGSGYATLLESIPQMGRWAPSRNLNKLEIGISTAIQFSTALLSYEIISQLPIESLFGVGYEIVHPLGANLSKFSDLTYVFWTALEDQPQKWMIIPFPFLIFNYSYFRDLFIIRSARASQAKTPGVCKIDSDELHLINPIYRKINPNEIKDYSPNSFNSRYICNVFLWQNFKKADGMFATLGQYNKISSPIVWTNEFTKNEGIDVNLNFLKDSIAKIAMQANVEEL
ncbi:hypothetical protein DSCW_08400 [Desulfosarcina widdelii]|uniref:Uncharacterized protein n=1 Tax=Desulfosarcina widdelii TaxID=947919 RepID=A0A5K7YZR8_9BACT|nr:hypothetical protein [Desulfosarcina widdelii]BBO73423.1 hypothetical protein DSCW_08400 [Desulfosarcina widdelii]